MEHGISCSSCFGVVPFPLKPAFRSAVSDARRAAASHEPRKHLKRLVLGDCLWAHRSTCKRRRSRFSAGPENDVASVAEDDVDDVDDGEKYLLHEIKGYKYEEETEFGTVVIKPLSEEWIPEVTEVLVNSFGETLGYRGLSAQFFRAQLRNYLTDSLKLGITGVVLVAILHANEDFEPPKQAESQSGPKFQGFSFIPPEGATLESLSSDKKEGFKEGLEGLLGLGTRATEVAKKDIGIRDFRDDLDDMSDDPPAARYQPGYFEEQPSLGLPEAGVGNGMDSSASSSHDNEDEHEEERKDGGSPNSVVGLELLDEFAGDELVSEGPAVIATPSETVMERDEKKEDEEDENMEKKEFLLGTVELSLDSSSRSSFFGFINPVKEGAYVSNMAVKPEFQRQGHATRLMTACEDIAVLSEMKEMSLHVRIKDEGAQALYRGYGFKDVKEDSNLLSLVGIDRKIFMRLPL